VRVREKERDIGERYPQVRENELKRLWVDQEVGGVDIMKGGGRGRGVMTIRPKPTIWIASACSDFSYACCPISRQKS